MAQLKTYDLPKLVGIEKDADGCGAVFPGKPVTHESDPNSYGIVLSRRWELGSNKPMQCEVLWSRQPQDVKATKQFTPSRPLRARWSPEIDRSAFSFSGVVKKTETIIGEETYSTNEAGPDVLREMMNEPGVIEVMLNSNGTAVVKREVHSIDELPDYLRGSDGRIKSLTYQR